MKLNSMRSAFLRTFFIGAGAICLAVIVFVPASGSYGIAIFTSTPTRYPTNYPPFKQTYEVGLQQTINALALTPTPTGYSLPRITDTPFLMTPVGTPAGVGVITNDFIRLPDTIINNAWYETTGNNSAMVYAGAKKTNPSQGIIGVERFSSSGNAVTHWYLAPTNAGAVTIVGAQGERLTLSSRSGLTLYFDVPSESFVSSLVVVVPTATLVPTYTPRPSATLTYMDDAPNDPWYIRQNSLVNTNLNYKINSITDVDWFRFHTDYAGTIQVNLTTLPANYDLYVYSATDSSLQASSVNTGTTSEQVTLANAPANDYYVRVVGVAGAFNATTPYTLRLTTGNR